MPLDRPLPAFYCCYLLRSVSRRSSLYVGSTPHPVRRLRQHNGLAKGGAVKTSKGRPWQMGLNVTGFPSNIAALQFEWAWMNSHITTHISSEERLSHSTQKKRSGHPKRPRYSMTSLLSNLHLLLRVKSFARWPLELRFYSEDIYNSWLKWVRVASEPISPTISIVLDFPPTDSATKPLHGIEALDVDYAPHKAHVLKAKSIVDFELEGACGVCREELEHDQGLFAICPSAECSSVSHITCLSKHFLESDTPGALLPVKGTCPTCNHELRWVDMMKELSLRVRGQKEVEKLMKTKRAKKTNLNASQAIDEEEEEADAEEEDDDMGILGDVNAEGNGILGDSWHAIDDDSDLSDTGSVTSTESTSSKTSTSKKNISFKPRQAKQLGTVIEDSE